MDSSSSSHLPLPLLLSSFLLITVSSTIFLLLKLWKEVSEQHESAAPPLPLPPGPRKLPIIGNLHNLSGSKLPHHRLLELANAHGPLMHLQLGQLQTIVVSSAETAKQVYRTHDLTFSNRPRLLLVDIIFRNRDLAFAPYGEYWRQLRKLCVLELLSAKRVHSFGPIREQEVSRLVDDVRCCKRGAAVNISAMIFSLTYRIISRAAFGKPYKELESSFVQLTMEMIEIGSGFGVADVFPSWELLLLVTGVRSRLQKLKRESDRILHSIIEEHRAAAKAGESVKEEEEDLVDHQESVSTLSRPYICQYTNLPLKTNNCDSFLQELFFAGSETSSTALEWAMSELVRDERVMKKAQDEIRAVFGKRGEVEETGIHELNYLKMVIKESLRLHPPLPLLAPRESREQCELGGYGIPEKTKVIVNAWAIGRDPKYWSEPERFYPERFLDATSVDYKGNDFEFIPFGAGRRVCPGISFSISSVETALANLLFHFDWKLPQGMKPESLDMDKLFGATIRRKNDLHLIPTVWQP
ncbi:unnamed protein product [Linum tenue]|uniref:Uncharacterized protein n=1 Tax=Linum tenue TaxID=586396 RepID=A0AAV0LZQ4_9ROSI|nr:unnamed protein product [Linum tenue]